MRIILAALVFVAFAPSGWATPDLFVPAMEFGAKDCLFCHVEAAGGKSWNARGHWLLEEKQTRIAAKVNVAWLSDYTEAEPVTTTVDAEGPLNIPKTLHRGPFFEPKPNADALKQWIDSRGRYTTAKGEWPQYAGDIASSKYSPLDEITKENVQQLEVAWTWDAFDNSKYIKPEGQKVERRMYPDGFKATPIVVGGKLFIRTNFSGVAAIDPETGKTLWTHDPGTSDWGRPAIFGFATRGLSYWSDGEDERLLVCTGDSYLIALDP